MALHFNVDFVSVPLRGYGFEIGCAAPRSTQDDPVSVPLRGYGFEIGLGS